MLFQDTFLTIYIIVITVILGAVFGSFINCLSWRIAHGESVLKGRSHCATCNHVLGIGDLVPVFSYLFLKGKCRYCGEKISPRYMLTELLSAMIFLSIVLKYDISFMTLKYLILACILLGLSLVDFEIYEIPNSFLIAGILLWLVTLPLSEGDVLHEIMSGALGGFIMGGAMLLLSLLFDKVTGKESLGGGDIKLIFMLGLFQGIFGGLFNLILSCIIGLIMVAIGKTKRIPFGPAISIAAWMNMLVGDIVITWYLGLFM